MADTNNPDGSDVITLTENSIHNNHGTECYLEIYIQSKYQKKVNKYLMSLFLVSYY